MRYYDSSSSVFQTRSTTDAAVLCTARRTNFKFCCLHFLFLVNNAATNQQRSAFYSVVRFFFLTYLGSFVYQQCREAAAAAVDRGTAVTTAVLGTTHSMVQYNKQQAPVIWAHRTNTRRARQTSFYDTAAVKSSSSDDVAFFTQDRYNMMYQLKGASKHSNNNTQQQQTAVVVGVVDNNKEQSSRRTEEELELLPRYICMWLLLLLLLYFRFR